MPDERTTRRSIISNVDQVILTYDPRGLARADVARIAVDTTLGLVSHLLEEWAEIYGDDSGLRLAADRLFELAAYQ